MNEFDQYVKHKLKVRHYARYTDDFVFVSGDKEYLGTLIPQIRTFLKEQLALDLHPHKVTIRSIHQGADFLGCIARPYHRLVRTQTQRHMEKGLAKRMVEYKNGLVGEEKTEQSLNSYLGVLSHVNGYKQELYLKSFITKK